MAFVSEINPNVPVITDSNWRTFAKAIKAGGESESGYIPRDWDAQPLGSIGGTFPFPPELLIPRAEWKERIEEMERTKTRLSDICRASSVKWLNQAQTNFCWCYAVVQAVMIVRLLNNQPYVRMSPASVACIVKNFRNQGGWGGEALEGIVEYGVASEEDWPQNSFDRKYLEPSRANAALHKVTEWYDLRERSFDEKMSLLLQRVPVPSGYSWMGHEMCSCDPLVMPNGGYGCRDLNSYTKDGTFDEYILSESRDNADDAVAPRLVTPSTK